MHPNRIKSANINVRDALAEIINKELEFNRMLVTLTKVEISTDLKHLRVYVSVIPLWKTASVLRSLKKAAVLLADKLARKVKIKYIPKMRFLSDGGTQNFVKVERTIIQLHGERKILPQNKSSQENN